MIEHCTNIQYQDPFQAVLTAFARLYPGVRCAVRWVDGLHEEEGAWGRTHFDEDSPLIELDGNCPVAGAVDVLCHELAHVVVGYEAGHGDLWRLVYETLVKSVAGI